MPTQNVTWSGSSGNLTTSEGQTAVATRGTAPTVSGGKLAFTDAASTSPFITWDVGTGEQRAQATVSPFGGDSLYFRVVDASNWWRVRVRRQQVQTTTQVYVPPETRTEYEWRWNYTRGSNVQLHSHNQDGGLKTTSPSDWYYGWSTSQSTPPSSYVSSTTHDHLVPGAFAPTHTHNTNSGPSLTGNKRTTTIRDGYYQTRTTTTYYRWLHVERCVGGTVQEIRALQYGEGQAITPVVVEAAGGGFRLWHSGMTDAATTVDDPAHNTATRVGLGLGGPSDTFGTNLTSLTAVPLVYSPQRPTLLAPPNGATVDFTTLPSWQARYNNQNPADQPTHRRVRRRIGAATYEYEQANGTFSTAETDIALPAGAGSTVTWTPPAGVWVNGTTYAWSVAFRGEQSGQWGPYADDALVTGNSAPTLSISAPVGVQSSTQPAVVLLYADAQNDAPAQLHVKVFSAEQETAAGFNPDTTQALWDSSRIPASHSTLTVEDLTGGNYRIGLTVGSPLGPNGADFTLYARAWQSDGLGTLWATQSFRVAVLPPAAPSLTGYDDEAGGAIRVIGVSRDNLLSADAASHESSQLAWRPVSNASLELTTDDPQHGLQSLAVTALGAGDVTVETVEDVAVRVDLPLTGMTSTQHLGNARVVVEAFVVYDEEGREIGTYNVADGWQESEGQEPEAPPVLPGQLLVSAHPDRRAAQPLSGQALTNPAFVFVDDPNLQSSIAQVAFSINGVARPTETSPPWDLMGGSETSATPWDTSSLAAGTYTITAVVTPVVGNAYTLSGALVKEAQFAGLRVSPNDTLTPAAALTGQEMDGTVHVFLSGGDVSSVSWIVDGVAAGTDSTSPFVLPLDMTAVPVGATRRVEAAVTPPVGAVYTLAGSLTRGAQVQPGDEGYYNIGGGQVVGTGGKTYAPTPAGLVRGGTNHVVPAAIADPLVAAGRPEFATGQFFSGGRGIIEITTTGRKRIVLSMLEDTFGAAGQRVFTAYAGTSSSFYSTLHNLDIYATVGRGAPLSREIVVDGPAVVELRSSADNPYLSSIAVLNGAGLPLTPVDVAIEAPRLMLSTVSSRASAVPLSGQSLVSNAFIFVTGSPIRSVAFALDGASKGTDTAAPFDLMGGTAEAANPLDVTTLSVGSHTVTAVVTFENGQQQTLNGQFTRAEDTANLPGVRPYWSDDLVDSMGAATHTNYAPQYVSSQGSSNPAADPRLASFINVVRHSKLRYLRDDSYAVAGPTMRRVATDTGVKFITIAHHLQDGLDPNTQTNNNINNQRAMWDQNLDIIAAFGGPNEHDRSKEMIDRTKGFMPKYSQWARATDARRAKWLLSQSPTTWLTFASGGFHPYREWGDHTSIVDLAELHDYYGGLEPENTSGSHDDNHAWMREVDTYFLKQDRADTRSGSGRPVRYVSTETGYHNRVPSDTGHKGTPSDIDAIYVPRMYVYGFAQLRKRWVFDYELIDSSADQGHAEGAFGYYRYDGTPEAAANAVRTLITLTENRGTRPQLAPLDYTLTNAGPATKQYLLQTADGRYRLLLWEASRIWDPVGRVRLDPNDARQIRVNLPKQARTITVHQPDTGRVDTIGNASNTNNITVTSNRNLKVIEVTF